MDTNRTHPVEGQSSAVVYGGAAVLHRLSWPKLGSMETVCELFKDTFTPSVNGSACIVFDSYNTLTTKAPEQKRRCTQSTAHPGVRLELSTPVPAKDAFLANMNNKQAIMNLLGSYIHKKVTRATMLEMKVMQMSLLCERHWNMPRLSSRLLCLPIIQTY